MGTQDSLRTTIPSAKHLVGTDRAERAVTVTLFLTVTVLLTWFVGSCAAPATQGQESIGGTATWSGQTFVPSLPVSHPPFTEFHASWMQRLDEPYIYIDHYGSYTDTAALIPMVLREMRVQGVEDAGPPFCLFYDDPARTPVDQLRSRACVPIAGARSPLAPLQYDVLPSRTIAHAFVSGPYPDVPRAYPQVFAYMAGFGWSVDGPIRETYVIAPVDVRAASDYLCEIQVPVRRSE